LRLPKKSYFKDTEVGKLPKKNTLKNIRCSTDNIINQVALSQLKGIKYASMVSGVKVAREMGEEMGESFSE